MKVASIVLRPMADCKNDHNSLQLPYQEVESASPALGGRRSSLCNGSSQPADTQEQSPLIDWKDTPSETSRRTLYSDNTQKGELNKWLLLRTTKMGWVATQPKVTNTHQHATFQYSK